MEQFATSDHYSHFEKYEWCNTWWENANDIALPRVLLIGDSIAVGYHPSVKETLAGQANADLFASSRAIDAPAFKLEIAHMLALNIYRVIHFNNGLHGWHVPLERYRSEADAIVAQIRAAQPQAKLILATTTPISGQIMSTNSGWDMQTIQDRNRVVSEIAAQNDFPVNGLYSLMFGREKVQSEDGVHYLDEGKRIMADQVAALIRDNLV